MGFWPDSLALRPFPNVSTAHISFELERSTSSIFSLDIFLSLLPQLPIDPYLPRLQEAILASPASPAAIHPALWNAICLVSCSCFGSDFEHQERVFLHRLHQAADDAIAAIKHVDQALMAHVLEICYYLRMGRLQEASVSASSASRLFVLPYMVMENQA